MKKKKKFTIDVIEKLLEEYEVPEWYNESWSIADLYSEEERAKLQVLLKKQIEDYITNYLKNHGITQTNQS